MSKRTNYYRYLVNVLSNLFEKSFGFSTVPADCTYLGIKVQICRGNVFGSGSGLPGGDHEP